MGVNVELPAERSLRLMAPEKSWEYILIPMGDVEERISANRE
jgi:predicted DNA-binding helix-hairpin-helix protein